MATHEGSPLLGGVNRLPKLERHGEGGGVEVCGAGNGHPRTRHKFFARAFMITLTTVGGLVFIFRGQQPRTNMLLQQKPDKATNHPEGKITTSLYM